MVKPVPFPKPFQIGRAERDRKLELEQEIVRMLAHSVLRQVDETLDIFDDDETAGYHVFGAMVAALTIQRCLVRFPATPQGEFERKHLKSVRACLEDIQSHMKGMD